MKPDQNYTWRHLYNSSSAKTAKLKHITRCGVPQSDWVSGMTWGTPIVALAPPVGGLNE